MGISMIVYAAIGVLALGAIAGGIIAVVYVCRKK